MKKAALAEVIDQPTTSELETRIAAIEARLEKLDPTPKLEKLQPHPVGSNVYSISDLEGHYPLAVVGYERGTGRILVVVSPGDAPRSLPVESVRPLDQCPRAQSTPAQRFAHLDSKTRAFFEGRETARVAAITAPFVPKIPEQKRYSW